MFRKLFNFYFFVLGFCSPGFAMELQDTIRSSYFLSELPTAKKLDYRIVEQISPYFNSPYPAWKYLSDEIEDILSKQAVTDEQVSLIPKLLSQLQDQIHSDNKETQRIIGDKLIKVYRPNHGLAHGQRQGFLATDMIDLFLQVSKSSDNLSYFSTPSARRLMAWVKDKIVSDPMFKEKVQILASFQRTGRQSDGGSHKITGIYAKRDQENFIKSAERAFSDIFTISQEINIFAQALIIYPLSLSQMSKIPEDSKNLARILMATHYCDLRRVVGYPKLQIQSQIIDYLFSPYQNGQITGESGEMAFASRLWKRSGDYLEATGESYIDDPRKKQTYDNIFYLQAENPEMMIQALQATKAQDW